MNATLIIPFERVARTRTGVTERRAVMPNGLSRSRQGGVGQPWKGHLRVSFIPPTSLCLLKLQNQLSLQGFYL